MVVFLFEIFIFGFRSNDRLNGHEDCYSVSENGSPEIPVHCTDIVKDDLPPKIEIACRRNCKLFNFARLCSKIKTLLSCTGFIAVNANVTFLHVLH